MISNPALWASCPVHDTPSSSCCPSGEKKEQGYSWPEDPSVMTTGDQTKHNSKYSIGCEDYQQQRKSKSEPPVVESPLHRGKPD
jgi:hypothetical protein